MNTRQFYQSQCNTLKIQIETLKKKETFWAFARLFAFLGLILAIFGGFSISEIIGILLIFPALAIFSYVINHHLKICRERAKSQYLYEINKAELDCIEGDYSSFPDGAVFFEKEHPYLDDLDIFGRHSLYQYLNRTNTIPGATILADWLKHPTRFENIKPRQEAILELSEHISWRQNLRAVLYLNPSVSQKPDKLIEWCNAKPELKVPSYFIYLFWAVPIAFVVFGILWVFGFNGALLNIIIALSFFINYYYLKKINKIQNSLSRTYTMLESYSDMIRLIEQENFASEKLNELKSKFYNQKTSASNILKDLSKLMRRLDYRLNILVGLPLNLIFLWDIHQCMQLENWKRKNKHNIEEWFSAMAEFEALSSLANNYFNNRDWIFPNVLDNYFSLEFKEVGHPLIHADKRIVNDFSIQGNEKIALITGSNMSGKSTFLRTCGVNMVLAMAGSPVCAKKFNVSYVSIYSSMRIADSLEENTSSFYAELKKLAGIIKVVEKKERIFLLLDEILRGTNSNDRHTGSVALIRQLIKNGAPAILATHDLALSSLTEEAGEKIELYNFDVKIQGEELYFDYKLNHGICKSLNASILMKKMGIEM